MSDVRNLGEDSVFEIQSVSVKLPICSNSKKHDTYTLFLAIYAYQMFEQKIEKIWIMDHLVRKQCFCLTYWRRKSWRLLWEKYSSIIKRNHYNIQFLAILAHRASVAKSQMHCSAIEWIFTSRKSWLIPWWMECSHSFLRKAGLLIRKKIRPLPHSAKSIHKICDARKFQLWSVRKLLIEAMEDKITKFVSKGTESDWQ